MNSSEVPLDFEIVKKNAAKQGIDLSQIAIVYANLTDEERDAMKTENLISHESEGGTVIAHFRPSGDVAFPNKATGTLYLGAD